MRTLNDVKAFKQYACKCSLCTKALVLLHLLFPLYAPLGTKRPNSNNTFPTLEQIEWINLKVGCVDKVLSVLFYLFLCLNLLRIFGFIF